MKVNYLVTSLILIPFYAFSQSQNNISLVTISQTPENKNTQVITYSNEAEH